MKQTNFAKGLALSVGVLVLSTSLSFLAFAWTAPSSTPPNGNVAAPVNTGSTTQTKSGGLNVSGNVGVGTSSPGYKLDVNGSLGVRSTADFITSATGNRTVRFGYENSKNYARILAYGSGASPANRLLIDNVANGSNAAGGYIDFRPDGNYMLLYPSGGSSGFLRLYAGGGERIRVNANGNVGIGTASPAAKLDVAGQIKISGGSPGAGKVLTSDSNGLATWKTPATGFTFSASSCPTGQWVIGMDADGKVVCSGSGNTPPWSTVSCAATSDELLTASARKRVFVTSSTYPINQTDSATKVDAICTNEARSAGLSGNYKALIYINNNNSRINLQAVLPINKRFMHCGIVSGKAEWWELANNPSAMLGRSLPYPIKYTATGTVAGGSGTSVFTNFQPIGGGSYVGYSPISSGLRKIVGDSTRKDVRWAYILLSCSTTACKNAPRSLYCIQQ